MVVGIRSIATLMSLVSIPLPSDALAQIFDTQKESANKDPLIEVISLPPSESMDVSGSEFLRLYQSEKFNKSPILDKIYEYASINSLALAKVPRLPAVTVEEARKYFDAYLKAKQNPAVDVNWQGKSSTLERLYSSTYFGTSKSDLKRVSNPQSIPSKSAYLDRDFIKAIYSTAKRIIELTHRRDTLVLFGSSNYFVGRAIRSIVSANSFSPYYRQIVDFPISGIPNQLDVERKYVKEDVVNGMRLEHLKARLKSKGLGSNNLDLLNHDTYFIDAIGAAKDLEFVIEVILQDFAKKKVSFPNLNLISLTKIDIGGNRAHARFTKANPDSRGYVRVSLPDFLRPKLKMNLYEVNLPGYSRLENPPSDAYRPWPPYRPYLWQPEYDSILTDDPSQPMAALIHYFDATLNELKAEEKMVSLTK